MSINMVDMEAGDWVYDSMEGVEWSMITAGGCDGCSEQGEEYVFPKGELKGCKSGFCGLKYCGDCRRGKYAGMLEEWEAYVLDNAVWLVNLEEQDVESDDEEYNREYLAEQLVEEVRWVDKKRPVNWCVSCYLECTECPVETCRARAFYKGKCRKCDNETRDLKRKRVEHSVDRCIVEEVGAKKLRVTIDLTLD